MNVRHPVLLWAGLVLMATGGLLSMQPALLPPADSPAGPPPIEMAGRLAAFAPDPRHATEWQMLVPYLDNVTYVLATPDPTVRILATFDAAPTVGGDVVVTGLKRYEGTDADNLARRLVILHVESLRAR